MAHKVHPKIFRLQDVSQWSSRWLVKKGLSETLKEDFAIRKFLQERLKEASIAAIEIERFPGKTKIIIHSTRPGLIIGRGGEGIEQLKKELERKVFKHAKKSELQIEILELRNPWVCANLIGQWIARQLERRMPHRRTMKQAIEKAMINKEIQGVKIAVAGRLAGAEIARTEWLKKGNLPRQTLRANIDYAYNEAHTTYGVIGVKVWLYKGEK